MEKFLKSHADSWLRKAGHSRPMAEAARGTAGAWLHARKSAVRKRRRLYGGWEIVWRDSGLGTVGLMPIEVPGPARGEVTVGVLASAVSPGTERAYYLRLPHAQPPIPFRPGYSAAGVVVSVGAGVEGLRPGDPVAATGTPHASVATLPSSNVHRVSPGVDMASAATVMLGVISGHGVELSELRAGERVCVVGAGVIGLLAQRIALASGAGDTTFVATSRRRERAARAGSAADFLTADDDRVAELGASLVIEATGSPSAIPLSISAAGHGGRVVLLGSTRAGATDFPMQEVLTKRLEIIGAHVNTLDDESSRSGVDRRAQLAQNYLQMLADGRVSVDDLVARRVNPWEAEMFYRELADGGDLVGAVYDWTLLGDDERVRRPAFLRPPDVSGRGADPARRPAPPARGRGRVPALDYGGDPFADAQGMLRFGMVGCGDIASQNARAIATAPNTTLTATFDLDGALARDIASAHDAVVAGSYAELLERPDVDAVLLSVPHHLHAPLAREAAAAGRHVVVEKPPANDLRSAVEMVVAADEAGVVLSVCFPHRYGADIVAARRLIADGAVGEITGVTAELLMDRSPAYRLGGFSSRSISDWRDSREKAGGGVLVMNLSHYLDLLRFLTGLEADEVSAFGAGRDESEVEDAIAMSMRMANGALGSVLGSTQVRGSLFTQLRIWGSEGQITLENDPRFYTLKSVDGLRTTRWQSFGRLPAPDIRAAFLSRLATAIASGAEPDIGAGDALAVQALMEAAYRSMDSGRPVRPSDLLEGVPA